MNAASLKSLPGPVMAASILALLTVSVGTGLGGRSEARASAIAPSSAVWNLPASDVAGDPQSDPDGIENGGMGGGGGGGGGGMGGGGGGGGGGMGGGGGGMGGGGGGGGMGGGGGGGGMGGGGGGGGSGGGSGGSSGGATAPPPKAPTPAPAPKPAPPPKPPPPTTPKAKPADATDGAATGSSKGNQTSSKASKARIAWLAVETTERLDGALQYMVSSIIDKFIDKAILTMRRSVCLPGAGEGATAGTPDPKPPAEAETTKLADLEPLAVKAEKDDKLAEAQTAVDLLVLMRGSAADLTFQTFVHERGSDAEGALEAAEKALKMDPKLVGARIGRVFCKIALGKGAEALAHLDEDKECPKDDLLFGLTRVFAIRAATEQKARDDAAAAAAAKAGKKGGKSSNADDAKAKDAKDKDAKDKDAKDKDGKDKDGKDEVDPAEAELQKVAEAMIAQNKGYREVLEASLRLGAYDVSRKILEMWAAKAPNDVTIATLRTIIEIFTNKDVRARELLEPARAAAPADLNLLFLEGVLEVRADKLDKAMAVWKKGNEMDPMNGLLALAVAHGLDRKGSKDAMTAYRHAIEVDRKMAEPHAAIALLLNKKGDFEGAEAELIAATKLEARPEFYYYLAIIQGDRLGFMGRALDALRIYRDVGGDDPSALSWLEALENV